MRRSPLFVLSLLASIATGCDGFEHRSRGEVVWRRLCADCHGLDAAGNTPTAMGNVWADLRDDQWRNGGDRDSIEQVVREGVFAAMPAHDELSADDMRALLDWIYRLRGESR